MAVGNVLMDMDGGGGGEPGSGRDPSAGRPDPGRPEVGAGSRGEVGGGASKSYLGGDRMASALGEIGDRVERMSRDLGARIEREARDRASKEQEFRELLKRQAALAASGADSTATAKTVGEEALRILKAKDVQVAVKAQEGTAPGGAGPGRGRATVTVVVDGRPYQADGPQGGWEGFGGKSGGGGGGGRGRRSEANSARADTGPWGYETGPRVDERGPSTPVRARPERSPAVRTEIPASEPGAPSKDRSDVPEAPGRTRNEGPAHMEPGGTAERRPRSDVGRPPRSGEEGGIDPLLAIALSSGATLTTGLLGLVFFPPAGAYALLAAVLGTAGSIPVLTAAVVGLSGGTSVDAKQLEVANNIMSGPISLTSSVAAGLITPLAGGDIQENVAAAAAGGAKGDTLFDAASLGKDLGEMAGKAPHELGNMKELTFNHFSFFGKTIVSGWADAAKAKDAKGDKGPP